MAKLLPADFHKRRQMCKRDGLSAILIGCHLGDDLGCDVAGGGKTVGLFNQSPGDYGTVLKHILKIHQVAVVHVLGVVVHIVEVNDPLVMRLNNIRREQKPLADVLGHFARHIVALGGVDHRVLVGVLLFCLFIRALDQAEDLLVRGVGLTDQGAGIAIGDIALCHFIRAMGHELALHHVLNLFHPRRPSQGSTGCRDRVGHGLDGFFRNPLGRVGGKIRLSDGVCDFIFFKLRFGAVSFDDSHNPDTPIIQQKSPAHHFV